MLSDYFDIKYGEPQGTVVRPILFLEYINDLIKIPIESLLTCFVDDTVLLLSTNNWIDTYKVTEEELTKIKK